MPNRGNASQVEAFILTIERSRPSRTKALEWCSHRGVGGDRLALAVTDELFMYTQSNHCATSNQSPRIQLYWWRWPDCALPRTLRLGSFRGFVAVNAGAFIITVLLCVSSIIHSSKPCFFEAVEGRSWSRMFVYVSVRATHQDVQYAAVIPIQSSSRNEEYCY